MKLKILFAFAIIVFSSFFCKGFAQLNNVPKDRIMTDAELISLLAPINSQIKGIKDKAEKGNLSGAIADLAGYYKEKFAQRYFFSWQNFDERFQLYSEKFPTENESRIKAAKEHLTTYNSNTHWELPFKNLKGKEVSSYELRHLTRQNKAVDLAFAFFYSNEDTLYLNYFVNQVRSFK